MKVNPNDGKITLPDSSKDEEKSPASESKEKLFVSDPFQQDSSDANSALESEEELDIRDPFLQDSSDSNSAPENAEQFVSNPFQQDLDSDSAPEIPIKITSRFEMEEKYKRSKKRVGSMLESIKRKTEKKMKIESKKLQDLDKLPSDSANLPSGQESPEPKRKKDVDIKEEEGPVLWGAFLYPKNESDSQ